MDMKSINTFGQYMCPLTVIFLCLASSDVSWMSQMTSVIILMKLVIIFLWQIFAGG